MESGRKDLAFTRGNDWSNLLRFRLAPVGSKAIGVHRIYGVGPPPDTIGSNGDFFIDGEADVSYGPKAAGVWPLITVPLPPVDYSSCTFLAQLRKWEDSPDKIDLAVDDTNSAVGDIIIKIANADSGDLEHLYVWDLQMTDAAGLISTVLAGQATITPDVTREDV